MMENSMRTDHNRVSRKAEETALRRYQAANWLDYVVVEINSHRPSITWESQPLPTYQDFENFRNFLVAVEEMKLPAFEASDLERETLEVGSAAKVVDCILALKSYNEWKQMNGGNGFYKNARYLLVMQSAIKFPEAIETKSARLREVDGQETEILQLQDQRIPNSSMPLPGAHDNSPTASIRKVRKILFIVTNQAAGGSEFLTPQKKLLNSIET